MRLPLTSALSLALFSQLSSFSVQAEFFQWKDASGKIHYSDKVPPGFSSRGYSILDTDGQTVKQVEAQKSLEQIQVERRNAATAAEKERLRLKTASEDRALMVSFGDVYQLDKLRNERIQLLDSTISLTENKIEKIELQLEAAENRKYSYLAKDRKPPKQLEANITEYEKQLANYYHQISINEQRKQKIADKFAKDRSRFLELQALHSQN